MSGTLDPEYHRPEGMEMAGRVSGEGLWHCTMEDKAAADAYFLAIEARLERVEEALRQMPRPFIAGNEWWDWLEDVAGPALGYVPTPVKQDQSA